jgi:hypothetical protein
MKNKTPSVDSSEWNPKDSDFKNQRFRLAEENQDGFLDIGRKSIPVRVTEMTVSRFTALVDPKQSKKIKVNGLCRLRILDKDCKVCITAKRLLPDGREMLEMEQLDEIAMFHPNHPGGGVAPSRGFSAWDLALPGLIALAIFLVVLAIPLSGGKWSGSRKISDFAESTWKKVVRSFDR